MRRYSGGELDAALAWAQRPRIGLHNWAKATPGVFPPKSRRRAPAILQLPVFGSCSLIGRMQGPFRYFALGSPDSQAEMCVAKIAQTSAGWWPDRRVFWHGTVGAVARSRSLVTLRVSLIVMAISHARSSRDPGCGIPRDISAAREKVGEGGTDGMEMLGLGGG